MKKCLILLILLSIIALTLITGCTKNVVQKDIERFYSDFLDAAQHGSYTDFDQYVYYTSPEYEEYAREGFVHVAVYEIDLWKQLSDNLWVVQGRVMMEGETSMRQYFHFIGDIDGEYRIMLNAHHIPSDLKDGLDLSEYIDPNALTIDDLR